MSSNKKRALRTLPPYATDPGTVLDPTCGSGTTAYVAEQMGPPLIRLTLACFGAALAASESWRALSYYLLAIRGKGR